MLQSEEVLKIYQLRLRMIDAIWVNFSKYFVGHYVYIEANGHRQGAKARLIAPSYSGRSSTCFQFYYNMHGQHIGTLSVYKKTSRGLGTPIWSLSGEQGTGWQFGQVSIRGGSAYSVGT